MSGVHGPWYITMQAVESYLRILGWPEDDDHWLRAEAQLVQMARETVASGREPRPTASGILRYRGPRPRRLGLVVSTAPHPDGPLPQLVDVIPAHGGMVHRRG